MSSPATSFRTTFLITLACSIPLVCIGCEHTKVQAAAPVRMAPQPNAERPMNVAPDTDASPPQEADGPPPEVESNTEPPDLSAIPKMKMPPAPPKPPAEQPAEQATVASAHPTAPQIAPQLSPGEQQAYERNVNDDLSVAERNVQQASGRQLNAVQQDLLAKARSWLEQARDASKSGDWARAQNLAHKARLASIDFVTAL